MDNKKWMGAFLAAVLLVALAFPIIRQITSSYDVHSAVTLLQRNGYIVFGQGVDTEVDDLTVTGILTGAIGREATQTLATSSSPVRAIAQADVICDGVADQTEINTALLTTGKTRLSKGIYPVSGQVVMGGSASASDRMLVGETEETTSLDSTVSGSPTFRMYRTGGNANVYYPVITDLQLDLEHATGGGMDLDEPYFGTFERIRIRKVPDNTKGLDLTDSIYSTYDQIHIIGNETGTPTNDGTYGLYTDSKCYHNIFTNSVFGGNGGALYRGVQLRNATDSVFSSNAFEWNVVGLDLYGQNENITITGNWFEGNTDLDLQINGRLTSMRNDVVIVEGNFFDGSPNDSDWGISIGGWSDYIIIRNNTFKNHTSGAIHIASSLKFPPDSDRIPVIIEYNNDFSGESVADIVNEATDPSVLQRWGAVGIVQSPREFTDGDTSPSVLDGHTFSTANTGGTTITTFDGSITGQEITIIFTDALTTISEASNINLSAAFTSTADDVMRLIFDGTDWQEISRSVN